MTRFARNIRPHVRIELATAERLEGSGDPAAAFAHLERAHVLGQAATAEHVRVHWAMFRFGWRQRNLRECLGQLLRLLGAASKTALGWVPSGNTGGSNVSPFRSQPVPADLAEQIARARRAR